MLKGEAPAPSGPRSLLPVLWSPPLVSICGRWGHSKAPGEAAFTFPREGGVLRERLSNTAEGRYRIPLCAQASGERQLPPIP